MNKRGKILLPDEHIERFLSYQNGQFNVYEAIDLDMVALSSTPGSLLVVQDNLRLLTISAHFVSCSKRNGSRSLYLGLKCINTF